MKDRVIKTDGLRAVGVVHAETIPKEELRFGQKACIEVFEEYMCALDRFKEHTHFWILCWLDRAKRDVLNICSWHLREEKDAPYGVFALRSPCRPNPISLTLVRLLKIEGNRLYVDGLDIFDETPVLDIKPYMKGDVVFSPYAPYIRPLSAEFVRRMLMHHQEECASLALAVRMALAAEEYLGYITADAVSVRVRGNGCFADTVQGLTNARFANPPRLCYEGTGHLACEWTKDGISMTTIAKVDPADRPHDEIMEMDGDSLFTILFGKKDEDENLPLRQEKHG